MKSFEQFEFEEETRKAEGEVKPKEETRKNRTGNVPTLLKDISPDEANFSYIWEKVIAKGHVTILSALYKSGKSTLLRCLLRAMYNEEEFIGMPAKKARVLVISEESKSEWAEKRETFELSGEDLTVWIWSRPYFSKLNYKEWVLFITQEVASFCDENEIEMVVLDTVSTFWAVTNENDAMDMEQNLKPFIALTEKKIAVLLLQQDNKQGGNFGKSIRGSTALPGFADQLIYFSRPEKDNSNTRRREISFDGRLYHSEDKLIITLQADNTYDAGTETWKYSKNARRQIVKDILKDSDTPLTIKQIREEWDDSRYGDKPTDETIREYVKGMVFDEILKNTDFINTGKKGNIKSERYGLTTRIYSEKVVLFNESMPNSNETEPRDTTLGRPNRVVNNEIYETTRTSVSQVKESVSLKDELPEMDPRI